MSVKLRFRSISGQVFNGTFSKNAKIQDACSFLNKKLKSDHDYIYFVSPEKKQLFYNNNDNIQLLTKQEQNEVFFLDLYKREKSNQEIIGSQERMIAPPKSAMNAFNNFSEIQNIGGVHQRFYLRYASVIKNTPADMDDRVNQIAQFGYNVEDCREALRDADYDINRAVEILIRRHSGGNNDDDELEFSSRASTIFSLLRSIMLDRAERRNIGEEIMSTDETSTESSEDSEYSESDNESNQNQPERVSTPTIPETPSTSGSPRSSINRERVTNTNGSPQGHQNQPLRNGSRQNQRPRSPMIISRTSRIPRTTMITRPNVQPNQQRLIVRRSVPPKK